MKIFGEALANGKRLHRDVHPLLDAAEVKEETKRRAKWKLGVVSSKTPPWYWWLPGKGDEEAAAAAREEAKIAETDTL